VPVYRSLFISHGAPSLPLSDEPTRGFLIELGKSLPPPRGLIVISAHWQLPGFIAKTAPQYEAWHDFYGFPDELYRLRYEPRGDAVLGQRVADALASVNIAAPLVNEKKIDHGVWVPLLLMWPQADVPLVQLSLGRADPAVHFQVGRALRVLAEEGYLVIGSGGFVHNLREWMMGTLAPGWAADFEGWMTRHLEAGDWEALCDYRRQAPQATRAHPTDEHLLPLFVAGGAGGAAELLHGGSDSQGLGMACFGFR
jgi:4,5-DOPA dioxygenase extradiol